MGGARGDLNSVGQLNRSTSLRDRMAECAYSCKDVQRLERVPFMTGNKLLSRLDLLKSLITACIAYGMLVPTNFDLLVPARRLRRRKAIFNEEVFRREVEPLLQRRVSGEGFLAGREDDPQKIIDIYVHILVGEEEVSLSRSNENVSILLLRL